MEIRLLRSFLAVAARGSITLAAQQLHISQPALSKQLADLEAETGHQLFIRGKKRVTLTEPGIFLEQKAKLIISLADDTLNELTSQKTGVNGQISIGAAESGGFKVFSNTIREFHEQYPLVQLNFHANDFIESTRKLENGDIDYAVLLGEVDKSKFDVMELPYSINWGLLVNRSQLKSNINKVTPQDLPQWPLLYARQISTWTNISSWLGYTIDKLNIIGTYNLPYSASMLVRANLGAAIIPEGIVDTKADREVAFLPFEPPIANKVSVVWYKKRITTQAIDLFHSYLEKAVRNLWVDSFFIVKD